MEPVTHILTGACLSRTGLNRRAAYTTLAMAMAAELPDIDTLWSLRGPVAGFQHHRGITHTFLGLPFEAAAVVAAVYGLHRWRLARARRKPTPPPSADDHVRVPAPLTAAPVRWGLLYGFTLIALLSHLLLDYTNNYGLRPFFPFNPHWYAASIVFIFDPLIFALLLLALVAPAVFGWIGREVGARRQPFRGRGWAIAALLGVVALWTLRAIQHERAVQLAMAQSVAAPPSATPGGAGQSAASDDSGDGDTAPPEPQPVYLTAQRSLASPDPFSPFRWYGVTDFGAFYHLETIDTRNQSVDSSEVTYPKPPRTPEVQAADASPLGRAYLDWSPMPFITEQDSGAPAVTVVSFRDPRFMVELSFLSRDGRSPLTARVTIDALGHVLRQTMDGRAQH